MDAGGPGFTDTNPGPDVRSPADAEGPLMDGSMALDGGLMLDMSISMDGTPNLDGEIAMDAGLPDAEFGAFDLGAVDAGQAGCVS